MRMIEQAGGEAIIVEGELGVGNAAEFERLLAAVNTESGRAVTLDLSRFDIDGGVAVATAINSLRQLRARCSRLVLRGAPQMLCHNLYRVGSLAGLGAIELVDMRRDEPYE